MCDVVKRYAMRNNRNTMSHVISGLRSWFKASFPVGRVPINVLGLQWRDGRNRGPILGPGRFDGGRQGI